MEEGGLFSGLGNVSALISAYHSDGRFQSSWHKKWFSPAVLNQLLAIDHAIRVAKDDDLSALGKVALSDVLRKASNANGSYPNVMFDKNRRAPASPMPIFRRRLSEISERVAGLADAQRGQPRPIVIRADAQRMPLDDESVDAVVTHPPYIGSIPYAEYGYLSLTWLGYDANALDDVLTGGNRQSRDVVERFEAAFSIALSECRRVLRSRRYAFFLLGTPTVRGRRIDLPHMAKRLATMCGFSVDAEASRRGVNRRANLMGEESLLFLRRRD